MQPSKHFEEQVANLFRNAGALRVRSNVMLGGSQIDVEVIFRVAGVEFLVAVECKHYAKSVGIGEVLKFAEVLDFLRKSQLADAGVVVSHSGFSPQAHEAARKQRIHLLKPDDILCLSAQERCSTFGFLSDTKSTLYALEGIQNPRLEQFIGLMGRVAKARKLVPAVDAASLWRCANECSEIAQTLGDSCRAEALLLEGILTYDKQDSFDAAKQKFQTAQVIARRAQEYQLEAVLTLWIARCLAGMKKFAEATKMLKPLIERNQDNQGLAALILKSKYWMAKIRLLQLQTEDDSSALREIINQFQEVLCEADSLGIIHYREGARARLGEIAERLGDPAKAFRLYREAYEGTPSEDAQDREKLTELIDKIRRKLSPSEIQAIQEGSHRERPLSSWPPSAVQTCEFALWRFAKFPLQRILPRLLEGPRFEGLKELLADDEILDFCIDADRYDRSRPGAPIATGERKYRSLRAHLNSGRFSNDLLRRLRFAKRLLLGSALVNDTGRKGGVALVALDEEADSCILDRREGFYETPGENGLCFHYDSRNRLRLSGDMFARCRELSSELISQVVRRAEGRGVFPFSVDFLLRENQEPVFLELHYPSRGFVALYEPFRSLTMRAKFPVDIYANALSLLVEEARFEKVLIAHSDILQSDQERPRSATYGFEFQGCVNAFFARLRDRLIVCDDWRKTDRLGGKISYRGEVAQLVILDDVDPQSSVRAVDPQLLLPDHRLVEFCGDVVAVLNLCKELGVATPKWQAFDPLSFNTLDGVQATLGRLVIAKDPVHLPSWHAEKRRGIFLDLQDGDDQQLLARLARHRPILVETAVTSSVDRFGHFGELRIHCCAVR